MINEFIKYYQKNKLFNPTDKILLAVSGGKDSVLMVHLFIQAKLKFGIAHCNFKLRGDDADKDKEFIQNLAKFNSIPFYSTVFETKKYAIENGISIQMAARELRYEWFEKIRIENNYQYIATAHHKNDVVETILINLTKGTGLAGLHGILAKRDKIIRPLLCFTRKKITNYIRKNGVDFREDLSNAETKYTRNKIRHQIIPELEKINPKFIETLYTKSKHYLELEQIINQKIEEIKYNCCVYDNDIFKIDIDQLLKLTPLRTYLYYLIKDFGFNSSDIENIAFGLKNQSGKVYQSSSHQLLKDRKYLIVTENRGKKSLEYTLASLSDFSNSPIKFDVNFSKKTCEIQIKKSSQIAYLDLDKLQFPLILRKWKNGDIFQPFGMKGKKKVSDYFIDKKLSLKDKEDSWLLVSNQKIVWIVGYRIDDNFKITNQTKSVLELNFLK